MTSTFPFLATATSDAWLRAACAAPDLILLDHAHCEKKAAATALGLVFRHPERSRLVGAMSRLAREELIHFERTLGALSDRGRGLERLPPSPYGAALHALARTSAVGKLVDELLVAALIEARSRERFALLAGALADPALAALYRELGPAEERHAALYLDLAAQAGARDRIEARARELAAAEAEIVARPGQELRLHAGG